MSIEIFYEQQRVIQDILNSGPQAWVLALNHMRDRKIQITQNVAMFSTELLAQAYLETCELPKTIQVGQWVHYFRPDSVLWWHNKPFSYDHQGILPCMPWLDYGPPPGDACRHSPHHIVQDPAPPEGSWDLSPEDVSQLDEASKALIHQWKESGDA